MADKIFSVEIKTYVRLPEDFDPRHGDDCYQVEEMIPKEIFPGMPVVFKGFWWLNGTETRNMIERGILEVVLVDPPAKLKVVS